jgi:hypothetical protein
MVKKDYSAIANILLANKPQEHWLNKYCQYKMIALSLADYFQAERTAFNRAKFLKACGISE